MTTIGDRLAEACEKVDGQFSARPTQVKASCSLGNGKMILNDFGDRDESGLRVEMENKGTTVKGRIQGKSNNIKFEGDTNFVAGQTILQAKNPDGESIEIIR